MPVGPLSLWYVITISFVWSAPAGGLGAQGALAASQSGLHRRGHGGAVAIDAAGLGSIDLVTPNGQVPESVIRIFNDAGDAGTTGMSEEQIHRRSHAARRVAVDEITARTPPSLSFRWQGSGESGPTSFILRTKL